MFTYTQERPTVFTQDMLEPYRPLFKEPIFESIWLSEGVFDENGYTDHEFELEQLFNGLEDHENIPIAVENLYQRHLVIILKAMSVGIADDIPIFYAAKLLSSMNEMVRPENQDVLKKVQDDTDDDQSFLCTIAEYYTAIPFYTWMEYIDSFDESVLPVISYEMGEEITEEHLAIFNARRKLALRAREVLGSDNVQHSVAFIKNRDQNVAFGFSFKIAFMAISYDLEGYATSKNFARIASELLFLGSASSTDTRLIPQAIRDTLENGDFSISDIIEINKHVEVLYKRVFPESGS